MPHIERFGPFRMHGEIVIPGHIVEFTVDRNGMNFYIWSMVSKRSFDSRYKIVNSDVPLGGDFYLATAIAGVIGYHLVRIKDGGIRKGPRNRTVASKDEEPNRDYDEGDQQEILVEDSDPAVDTTGETGEVGEPVPDQEGESESEAT